MPCTRKYPLPFSDTPHLVLLDRQVHTGVASRVKPVDHLREQRAWLENEDNGCSGHYLDGARMWVDQSTGDQWQAYCYRFTDKDTAFFFKLRFG
jgi:hypothetical protein